MVNHPREYRLDMPLHSSYMILQTRKDSEKGGIQHNGIVE